MNQRTTRAKERGVLSCMLTADKATPVVASSCGEIYQHCQAQLESNFVSIAPWCGISKSVKGHMRVEWIPLLLC